jgi:hypothetical protein
MDGDTTILEAGTGDSPNPRNDDNFYWIQPFLKSTIECCKRNEGNILVQLKYIQRFLFSLEFPMNFAETLISKRLNYLISILLMVHHENISARRPAILTEECSCFFSVLLGQCRDSALKTGHDRFLLHPFQLIIHLSSFHSTLFSRELL